MILFLKLLLAHLIGDFLLQPDKWIAEKETKQYKSNKLYWHTAVHFILIMILVGNIHFIGMAMSISLLHGIIDFLKLIYQNQKNKRTLFFVDQIIHISILAISVMYWQHIDILHINIDAQKILLITTAFVFLSIPSSVIVKIFISKWSDYTQVKSQELQTVSLQNAGKIIGILERFLVLTFILINHWEAIGFLITAKSVFRFSDLKQAQDRKLTEYILIGTLSSYSLAIACGLIVKMFL